MKTIQDILRHYGEDSEQRFRGSARRVEYDRDKPHHSLVSTLSRMGAPPAA